MDWVGLSGLCTLRLGANDMQLEEAVKKILYAKTAGGGFFKPLPDLLTIKPEEGRAILIERAKEMQGLMEEIDWLEYFRFYEEFEVICFLAVVFAWGCINPEIPVLPEDIDSITERVQLRVNGIPDDLAGSLPILESACRILNTVSVGTLDKTELLGLMAPRE